MSRIYFLDTHAELKTQFLFHHNLFSQHSCLSTKGSSHPSASPPKGGAPTQSWTHETIACGSLRCYVQRIIYFASAPEGLYRLVLANHHLPRLRLQEIHRCHCYWQRMIIWMFARGDGGPLLLCFVLWYLSQEE